MTKWQYSIHGKSDLMLKTTFPTPKDLNHTNMAGSYKRPDFMLEKAEFKKIRFHNYLARFHFSRLIFHIFPTEFEVPCLLDQTLCAD